MRFTIAPPGTAPESPAPRPAPSLGKPGFKRGWISPSVYDVIRGWTADGEWGWERAGDGTWAVSHQPSETVVKAGFRSRGACAGYVASGKAQADLERIQAEAKKGEAA